MEEDDDDDDDDDRDIPIGRTRFAAGSGLELYRCTVPLLQEVKKVSRTTRVQCSACGLVISTTAREVS
jgi:hypothetical protein